MPQFALTLAACIVSLSLTLVPRASAAEPELVSVEKIWDAAHHCAFTDLIRFQDRWYCSFRESDRHVYGKDGAMRVLESDDGRTWRSAALIEESGVDLRDPKLSITSDGRLMMIAGGSVYDGRTLVERQPRVLFSADGREWTKPQRVLSKGDWLWRVTWHNGRAYGTSYDIASRAKDGPQNDPPGWILNLYTSQDGLEWERITALHVPDRPNETTVRFLDDGRMMALARREAGDKHAWIGTSSEPFTDWKWHDAGRFIGGPNFIQVPNGTLWAVGRNIDRDGEARTVLGRLTETSFEPALTLPSGGDTSYAGLVYHDGLLWVSYYSKHEGPQDVTAHDRPASIYLAQVKLPE